MVNDAVRRDASPLECGADSRRVLPTMTQAVSRLAAGAAAVTFLGACGAPDPGEVLAPFQVELARLAREAEGAQRIAVAGLDDWLFLGRELRHVSLDGVPEPDAGASPSLIEAEAAPVATILDVHRQLDARGVELLLVPVPPKSVIFPEKVSAALTVPIPVPRLDPALEGLYDRLRAGGVAVLDLTDHFIRERFHPEGPLYCRTDTHWSGSGCTTAAAAIAAEVRARPWYAGLETESFGAAWYSTGISGDLTGPGGVAAGREELRLRGVIRATGGEPTPVAPDPESPLLLLGDSHALVFHAGGELHAAGAGLPDQLAFELGLAVDLAAAPGPGAAAALEDLGRRTEADPDYWSRKRLVIWCFAARALGEGDDWRPIRIAP